MANDTHFDVIIIGTGAGGGTLAFHLAPSGKRILVLERGSYLPRETANWDSRAVFADSKYRAKTTWYDKQGKSFHPGIHYYVGGNTKVYGAALLRFRREDFEEVKHHGGISPAWPIRYQDLEPYYTQAEYLYHVHGQRGIDPTEGPASAPYRHPPVSHEPRIQELCDDLRGIGHTPFPLPLGIRLNEAQRHHSPCIRCATCDGFPCLVEAKADAHTTCVQPALAYPNVTLLTDAYVSRLATSYSGREITAVHVRRGGMPETYSADLVVVSCGAVNSAALLLQSANDQHPNGLANRSGVVGRHYMCHNNSALLALSTRRNPTTFQKTLALNDFYFSADDWDFPLGHIQMLGKTDLEMLKGDAPTWTPRWVLDGMATHSLDFWLTSEDLPDPDNRVLVASNGDIHLHYTQNNLEGHRRLVAKLKSALDAIGRKRGRLGSNIYLGKKIPLAGTAHQCGTIRFGHDPMTSALDVNCKTHDLDNLYVVDASFFVSSTAVNPSLTIIANALRVGDHILERLGARVEAWTARAS
ncbi:MAG: GMC family oxidoreductase [Nitrospirota bacterium]